jgi:hypothetical protein
MKSLTADNNQRTVVLGGQDWVHRRAISSVFQCKATSSHSGVLLGLNSNSDRSFLCLRKEQDLFLHECTIFGSWIWLGFMVHVDLHLDVIYFMCLMSVSV